MLTAELRALIDDPPKLHFWKGQWNAGGMGKSMRLYLVNLCNEHFGGKSFTSVETGAGLSTLLFLACGARQHVAIAPDAELRERIAKEIVARGLKRGDYKYMTERSEDVLPKLADTEDPFVDLALIDGGHGWPTVFVDFCYTNKMLKGGGLLLIDDLQLYSCHQLALLLQSQPGWELLAMTDKLVTFRKTNSHRYLPDFGEQPFILVNSIRK
jgi:hypothetical protein